MRKVLLDINGDVLRLALTIPSGDFEDSVTAAAAHLSGCDTVVTRDPRGFPQSAVRVVSPRRFWSPASR